MFEVIAGNLSIKSQSVGGSMELEFDTLESAKKFVETCDVRSKWISEKRNGATTQEMKDRQEFIMIFDEDGEVVYAQTFDWDDYAKEGEGDD